MSTSVKAGIPARQGFYKIRDAKGNKHIAEWREFSKGAGKSWWTYHSEDPTVTKTPQAFTARVVSFEPVSKDEVANHLKRDLTTDELIEASYQRYKNESWSQPTFSGPMPDSRKLEVGDLLYVGALPSPRVVALHENGEVVTYQFNRSTMGNWKGFNSTELQGDTVTRTEHWLGLIKQSDQPKPQLAKNVYAFYSMYSNSDISSLVSKMRFGDVSSNPDYQRGYVWTLEDKVRLLDALFEGREIGRFIFVKNPYPQPSHILDGKQRLGTIMEFISSQLPYKGVYWHELSNIDRRMLLGRSVQYATLQSELLTRADLLRIFLATNAAGVPQTPEHLQYVQTLLEQEEQRK